MLAQFCHLAVDHVADRRSARVLSFGFDVDLPVWRVERSLLERHPLRAGIDPSGKFFAVPMEFQDDVGLFVGGGSPVAAPRALQRMPELRESGQRDEQSNGASGKTTESRDRKSTRLNS